MFQWIVSGLLGVDGHHVLSLVEMDLKNERGLKPQLQKMVAKNVLEVTAQEDHVKNENVQV